MTSSTPRSRSGLTTVSRHTVGTHQETELARQGTFQLIEPLWTDLQPKKWREKKGRRGMFRRTFPYGPRLRGKSHHHHHHHHHQSDDIQTFFISIWYLSCSKLMCTTRWWWRTWSRRPSALFRQFDTPLFRQFDTRHVANSLEGSAVKRVAD